MTEKRYKVIGYINGRKRFAVFDNVSDYSIAYFDNHIEAEQLCGKLNELYDENQYLKQQNIMLRLNVEKLGDDVKYLRGLKKNDC